MKSYTHHFLTIHCCDKWQKQKKMNQTEFVVPDYILATSKTKSRIKRSLTIILQYFHNTGFPRYSRGLHFREIWIHKYQNRYSRLKFMKIPSLFAVPPCFLTREYQVR